MRREGYQASKGGNEHPERRLGDGTMSKRFKLSKKSLEDCSGVNYARVPRKLRSVMKKQNRRSSALASQKLLYGKAEAESNRKNDKPDVGLGSITKDEAEVVETLFSLSRMFAEDKILDTVKQSKSSSKGDAAFIPEEKLFSNPVFRTDEGHRPSVSHVVKSSDSSEEYSMKEQAQLDDNHKLWSRNSSPDLNGDTLFGSYPERKETNEKPLLNSLSLKIQLELSMDVRLRQGVETKAKPSYRVNAVDSQLNRHSPEYEKRTPQWMENPDLSDWTAGGTAAWIDAPRTSASETNAPKTATNKVDLVYSKRSAKHVYITRLIAALKLSDRSQGLDPLFSQSGIFTDPNYPATERSGVDVSGAVNKIDTTKDLLKVGSAVIQQERLWFECLRRGNDRSGTCAARNEFGTRSPLQLPFLQQNHNVKSLPLSRSCFTLTGIQQGQLQPQLYPCNGYLGSAQASHVAFNQQQQFWMPRMSIQPKPNGNSLPINQIPIWRQGKSQNSSSAITYPQYTSLVPQHQAQHYMVTGSPLAAQNSTRRHHNIPFMLPPEDKGAGFYPGGALSLQLLCNERI